MLSQRVLGWAGRPACTSQSPGLWGATPNSQHLRVETPRAGVWVLQAEGVRNRGCFIVSKCSVRALHPHSYKGPDRASSGFGTIPRLGQQQIPHHQHCATRAVLWEEVTAIDSFHRLGLHGQEHCCSRLPPLLLLSWWGTAACKRTPSGHFGWTLFPAGSSARGWSRSPRFPAGCLGPLRHLPLLPRSGRGQ